MELNFIKRTEFAFSLDGTTGGIQIIHDEKNELGHLLVNTTINTPRGRFTQKSWLNEEMLLNSEGQTIAMLVEMCIKKYKKEP